jgi:hypothetical protein
MHFGIGWREKRAAIVRKEPAVPVVPTAKFGETSLNVTELFLRQFHLNVVIVGVPDCVAINCKGRVFAKSLFVMQTLDPAVRLITWQPVFLLELRPVAARYYAADAELDPVVVFFGLLFRGRSCCLAIARVTGADRRSGKDSRKNQHQESARGVRHDIEISI